MRNWLVEEGEMKGWTRDEEGLSVVVGTSLGAPLPVYK